MTVFTDPVSSVFCKEDGSFVFLVITDGKRYPKPAVGDIKNVRFYYRGLYAGEQFFYLLSQKQDALVTNTDGKYSGAQTVMEVYDYIGNPVRQFTFDIEPNRFVVDERSMIIYGYSFDHEDYLLRYRIN